MTIICLQVTNFDGPKMHLQLLKTLNKALDVAYKYEGIATEMLFSESMLDKFAHDLENESWHEFN